MSIPCIVYVPWAAKAMGTTPVAYFLDCAARADAKAADPAISEADRAEWQAEAEWCRKQAWHEGGPKPIAARKRRSKT